MRYCGQLGEEKFDRIVAPLVRARLLGGRRFYSRKELDAWIDGPDRWSQTKVAEQLLARLDEAPETRRRPTKR